MKFNENGYIMGLGETKYPFCGKCGKWLYHYDFIEEGIWIILFLCHSCNHLKIKYIK